MSTKYYIELRLMEEHHQDETGRPPTTLRVQDRLPTRVYFMTRDEAKEYFDRASLELQHVRTKET